MILDQIIARKRDELEKTKSMLPLSVLQKALAYVPPPISFGDAIAARDFALIAEIKKASPSAGTIVEDYDPLRIAQAYKEGGAAALSILTERHYFQGDLDTMRYLKQEVQMPVLRKDFLFDLYQIFESRMYGADAVLLIVRILEKENLQALLELSQTLELTALVEVHREAELATALELKADVIGINNRDLDTLKVDLETTPRLLTKFPEAKEKIIISESGISSRADVEQLRSAGVRGVLIGETLLRSGNILQKISELMGGP